MTRVSDNWLSEAATPALKTFKVLYY